MLISRYSAPEFDPYGDRRADEPEPVWPAPLARGPLDARVALPGSKSLTARELVLSALAEGASLLTAPLHSRDADDMVSALRGLGVGIADRAGSGRFGGDLAVTPPDELTGSTTIDCGQAGTVMRFVPPVAALALGPTVFDADDSARHRPMTTMIRALQSLGVDVDDSGSGRLPFTVHGTGRVRGGTLEIDASASSQFVSGLLLAAARFDEGLDLTHTGERLPSLPHIEMTIAALAARGVVVETPRPGRWIVAPQTIGHRRVAIEPDLSNAAPFLAAAVVAGGSVTVTGWPEETTQVGASLVDLLPAFGARVDRGAGEVTVTGDRRPHGATLDLSEAGELAPALAAIAATADSPTELTGIGHIRLHETDRLAALVDDIRRVGGRAEELPDGIRIEPADLVGAVWGTFDDHRMATAGAVVGLAVAGVELDDVRVTAKTLPQFPELWHAMVAGGDPMRPATGSALL